MIPGFLAVPLVSNVSVLPAQIYHLKCDNTRSASVDRILCGKYCDPDTIKAFKGTHRLQGWTEAAMISAVCKPHNSTFPCVCFSWKIIGSSAISSLFKTSFLFNARSIFPSRKYYACSSKILQKYTLILEIRGFTCQWFYVKWYNYDWQLDVLLMHRSHSLVHRLQHIPYQFLLSHVCAVTAPESKGNMDYKLPRKICMSLWLPHV